MVDLSKKQMSFPIKKLWFSIKKRVFPLKNVIFPLKTDWMSLKQTPLHSISELPYPTRRKLEPVYMELQVWQKRWSQRCQS